MDMSAAAKWSAWNALKEMDVGDAMEGYVNTCTEVCPETRNWYLTSCEPLPPSSASPVAPASEGEWDDESPEKPQSPKALPPSKLREKESGLIKTGVDVAIVGQKEPLGLPPDLSWDTLNLKDSRVKKEVQLLLKEHYVENTSGNFRILYSESFLEWDMCGQGIDCPGAETWQIGLRNGEGSLVGFLSGIPIMLKTWENEPQLCSEINFFCIHRDYRKRKHQEVNLARIIISEITRRVYQADVRLALFTGGQELPDVVSRVRYYHRKIAVRRLIDVGFSYLPNGKTMEELETEFALPEESRHKGLRAMEERDVPRCLELLSTHNKRRHQMYRVFSEKELAHCLLRREGVVSSFVIEDDAGVVHDFFSYYSVPSSIVHEGEITP